MWTKCVNAGTHLPPPAALRGHLHSTTPCMMVAGAATVFPLTGSNPTAVVTLWMVGDAARMLTFTNMDAGFMDIVLWVPFDSTVFPRGVITAVLAAVPLLYGTSYSAQAGPGTRLRVPQVDAEYWHTIPIYPAYAICHIFVLHLSIPPLHQSLGDLIKRLSSLQLYYWLLDCQFASIAHV